MLFKFEFNSIPKFCPSENVQFSILKFPEYTTKILPFTSFSKIMELYIRVTLNVEIRQSFSCLLYIIFEFVISN